MQWKEKTETSRTNILVYKTNINKEHCLLQIQKYFICHRQIEEERKAAWFLAFSKHK